MAEAIYTPWSENTPPHAILPGMESIPPEGLETLKRVIEWHQLNCAECHAWGHVHGMDYEHWIFRP